MKAGSGGFKSERPTKPVTTFNKKKLARMSSDFLLKRTDTFDTKEFAYSGTIVGDQSPAELATATTIEPLGNDNGFFGICEVQSIAEVQYKRRGLPDGTLIVDGATGSELDRRGVDCISPLWSARANLDSLDILKEVHRHYLKNGAAAVTTNTFRTHERILAKVGLGHLAKSLTQNAVKMAVEARNEVNPDALVLGCVAPLEMCYNANITPDFETCKKEHKQNMNYLLEAGVDFILIETMGSGKEAIAATQVANELAPGHWGISFSVSSDTVGILRCGTPMSDIIDNFKAAAFIGINCMDGMTLTP